MPPTKYLAHQLPDPYHPERTRYVHGNCPKSSKSPIVIPARFVTACQFGHLDDFPWLFFVHRGGSECRGPLELREYGVTGTASDVSVKCRTCQQSRVMSEAFGESGEKNMPRCRGRHPHLRKFDDEGCTKQMETILLGASNSWFPITLSAITLPIESSKAVQLVEKHWAVLENATSLDQLQAMLSTLRVLRQLPELVNQPESHIWEEIQRRRDGTTAEGEVDLKTPEWRIFAGIDPVQNTPDFQVRRVAPPVNYEPFFSQVVLLETLREVRALVGFTRIESPHDANDTGEILEERWAPIGRGEVKWVPATEIRGEGIFLQFNEPELQRWERETPGLDRFRSQTVKAHRAWRQARQLNPDAGFPGLRYLLIHSFAHALMRELALECGYTAASLRERIYSRYPQEDDGPQAGVLLYTAAPDSEGTLGGLVALGEPEILGRHIERAIEALHLCASDPLCAEHDPAQVTATLHWAACHSCLFSPETSCERGNRYLDRAVISSTVKFPALAYFRSR